MLGKHSGLAGLRHELSYLGIQMAEEEERALLAAVRQFAEINKTPVPAFTLVRLAASLIDARAKRTRAASRSAGMPATLESVSCH